jgi:O-antigen ligase
MFVSGPGLTGRQNIWPAFLELWYDSPLLGVGQPGIEAAGGLAALTDEAHNIFVDELARYGVLGMITLLASLGIGVFATFRAAARGFAGPAAIVTAYLALAMTDVRNDWIQPSLTGLMFVLAVVAAEAPRPGDEPADARTATVSGPETAA